MSIARGLKHLGFTPNEDFVLQDDGAGPYIYEWLSNEDRPTLTDIEIAATEHENDHTWKRKAEYPSIDELVVALWEGVVEERMAAVTSLEGKRQAVKTKYPK